MRSEITKQGKFFSLWKCLSLNLASFLFVCVTHGLNRIP